MLLLIGSCYYAIADISLSFRCIIAFDYAITISFSLSLMMPPISRLITSQRLAAADISPFLRRADSFQLQRQTGQMSFQPG
jgi:hypothetical protein